jgi:hypothetical protein
MLLRQYRERLLPLNYFPAMGTINHQEVTKLKISAKITTTIGAAAIFAMLVVPAMASTTTHGAFLAGNGLGSGNDLGDTLLLARGGNGNRGEGKGSGDGSGDRDGSGSGDRDRDRDGSCLDSITAPNATTSIILVGNGNGSGDQDQDKAQDGSCDDGLASNGNQTGDQDGDKDQDQSRDGSCLDSITAPSATTSIILAGNGNGSGDQDQDKDQDQDRDASCQV